MRNLILGLALTLAATVKSAQAETVNEKTARCYGYLDQANQSLTTEMHVYDNTLTPYLENLALEHGRPNGRLLSAQEKRTLRKLKWRINKLQRSVSKLSYKKVKRSCKGALVRGGYNEQIDVLHKIARSTAREAQTYVDQWLKSS